MGLTGDPARTTDGSVRGTHGWPGAGPRTARGATAGVSQRRLALSTSMAGRLEDLHRVAGLRLSLWYDADQWELPFPGHTFTVAKPLNRPFCSCRAHLPHCGHQRSP